MGTKIEQNWEHVKIAWNQISEFIQMEILNGNASVAFRNDAKNLLMVMDKLGQHFFDNNKSIMDVAVVEVTPEQSITKKALMFLLDNVSMNGSGIMGWGYKAQINGKTESLPVFYLGQLYSNDEFGLHLISNIDMYLHSNSIRDANVLQGKEVYGNNIINTSTIDWMGYNTEIGVMVVIAKDGTETVYAPYQSDRKLKKEIKSTKINALDCIRKLRHVQFTWKRNDKSQNIGYIAQEVEKINSDLVQRFKIQNKEGKEHEDVQINMLAMLATATKAIQEQQEEIEELKQKIEKLEKAGESK